MGTAEGRSKGKELGREMGKELDRPVPPVRFMQRSRREQEANIHLNGYKEIFFHSEHYVDNNSRETFNRACVCKTLSASVLLGQRERCADGPDGHHNLT